MGPSHVRTHARVAEWHTHQAQTLGSQRACGFESRPEHRNARTYSGVRDFARVVEQQTRSAQTRLPQGVGVQLPPRVPMSVAELA